MSVTRGASSTFCGGVDTIFSAILVPPSSGNHSKKINFKLIVSHDGGHRQCAGVGGHGPVPVRGLHAVRPDDHVFERVTGHLRLHSQRFEIQVNARANTIQYRSLCVHTVPSEIGSVLDTVPSIIFIFSALP